MKYTMGLIGLLSISFCSEIQGANNRYDRIEWAINNAWLLPGAIFNRIQSALSHTASAFERLWFLCTGRSLEIPEQRNHDLASLTMPENTQIEDELETINTSWQEIYTISSLALENHKTATIADKLSDLELETLEILKDATHKTLQADLLAGGGGIAVLYWLYREHTHIMARKIPKRFVGTGIIAIGTLKTMLPLLTPLGVLLVGAYAWYKLKESILDPYRKRHRSEIEKFKEELALHKKSVEKTLQKQLEHTREFTEKLEGALELIKKDFHEELKNIHHENVTLQKHVKNEVKEVYSASTVLQKDIHKKQDALREQVSTITQEIHDRTEDIAHDVRDMKKTNQELSSGMAKVLPRLVATQALITQMKDQSAQGLERIKQGNVHTIAPKKQEKKKKRFGIF